ncbi:zinc dependent phospholipase C family protein [Myxococcota bacterium]|nr:zinc dependent phospholipase C family protein [Myxococcota bacterium]
MFRIPWFVSTLCCLGLLLLFPAEALAYGPITHVNLGSHILNHLSLLPPALAQLLQAHPHAYLYGNMAADVIIAKNLAKSEEHCHNWSIGFSVLDEALDEQQQAFAWGYLSHLAADTIAHNYFVPWKLTESFQARTTGHAYWEVRLDQRASPAVWDLARHISRQKFHGPKELLSRTIQGTIFGFETNLVIFRGMLFVQRLKRWQGLLDRVDVRSRWSLGQEEATEQFNLSIQAIVDLFHHQQHSRTCLADPTGIPNLRIARILRKGLRKMQIRHPLPEPALQESILCFRDAFRTGVGETFQMPKETPRFLIEALRRSVRP